MTRHKYYVLTYVQCPDCGGSGVIKPKPRVICGRCDENGEVAVRVPLVKALADLRVRGMLPTIGG
jgi:DnaJ-class molecular chaperone